MRVSILTQPLGHNYGGLLQAYALQTYLKSIGCEVETLDRRGPKQRITLARNYLANVAKLLLGRTKSIPTATKQALVFEALTDFRDCKLTMSKRISTEQEVRAYFLEKNFDAVIVGSDQVWRPRYSPSILNFYLDFLNDIKSSAKRIAYGASFGVDNWEYSDEVTNQCAALAKKFDAVSVREQSAVELCKNKLDISATWVLDPTLLLNPSDYDCLINDVGDNQNKGCVLSYVLDSAEDKRFIVNIVGKSLNENVFSIKPESSIEQVRNTDIQKCIYGKVEIWLQGFRDASFVVTDSFHGTVFAILFNKPFITIGNSARGMARFESLLSQFGLEERLVESSQEVVSELIQQKIDWESVNEYREKLADKSRGFIRHNLFGGLNI